MTTQAVHDLELKLLEDFVQKDAFIVLEKKVSNLHETVDEHKTLLALLGYRLGAIQDVLVRIAWLIATPLIGGIGYLLYHSYQNLLP